MRGSSNPNGRFDDTVFYFPVKSPLQGRLINNYRSCDFAKVTSLRLTYAHFNEILKDTVETVPSFVKLLMLEQKM